MNCQYSIDMAETCNCYCWIYDYGSDLLSPSLNDSSPYPHNSSLIPRVAFRLSPENHAFGTHPSSHHENECVKCTFPAPSHENERKSESGLNDVVRFILSCRRFRDPGMTTEIVTALIKATWRFLTVSHRSNTTDCARPDGPCQRERGAVLHNKQ